MAPSIQFAKHIHLSDEHRAQFETLLQQMFSEAERVVVDREFTVGSQGGGWVFRVEPIQRQKKLPVIVKIAAASQIQKEWHAYNTLVRGSRPKAVTTLTSPIWSDDGRLGALPYYVAGDGLSPVEPLLDYFQDPRQSAQAIEATLGRLSTILVEGGFLYHQQRRQVSLAASYDPILPVNLLIQPEPLPVGTLPTVITPHQEPPSLLEPGMYVRLEGFLVTKVDLRAQTITLNAPRSIDEFPTNSYLVRLKYADVKAFPDCAVGQPLAPTEGRIQTTRLHQWRTELAAFLPGALDDFSQPTITLEGVGALPNPFAALPTILDKFMDLKVGYIHGDLNLGNILIEKKGGELHFIDFAQARWDHLLHDVLRLETEVVTKVLAPLFASSALPLSALCHFYEQLHLATFEGAPHHPLPFPIPALERPFLILRSIREMALEALFDRKKYADYYNALTLYLLGSLKFASLNPSDSMPRPWPKEIAFWSAAFVQQVCLTPPERPALAPAGNITAPSPFASVPLAHHPQAVPADPLTLILGALELGTQNTPSHIVSQGAADLYALLRHRFQTARPEGLQLLAHYEQNPSQCKERLKQVLLDIAADQDQEIVQQALRALHLNLTPRLHQPPTSPKYLVNFQGEVKGNVTGDHNTVTMNFD